MSVLMAFLLVEVLNVYIDGQVVQAQVIVAGLRHGAANASGQAREVRRVQRRGNAHAQSLGTSAGASTLGGDGVLGGGAQCKGSRDGVDGGADHSAQ
ncbi:MULTISPECIES: hypothetical protein [Brevibacterium]|uniref:hypothetical protein n=1 Tax=Brevibacterium TaxID=1696 RepID=UPI0025C047BB|nr:hypothetical protein [Brevibacterium sp.]